MTNDRPASDTTKKVDPLTGGGEMGALMRSIDWSKTAVGPVSTWPQSLRTALSILLDTGFPMYIAWGPELIQFYNDGYRPILGSTKHPSAMGRSTRQTFAEIWSIIGPMFQGVLEGTATTLVDFLLPLDRHGFVEECYFIFSYSPIREEGGSIGGVLVTVTETTERVLGARRLKTLQALAARTQEAPTAEEVCRAAADVLAENPADLPFALLYLLGPDGGQAMLAGTAGIEPGTPASPLRIDLASPDLAWTLAPPGQFLVLPIAQPGQDRPSGVLVSALSPRLLFDENYRSFLELAAGQIATAISRACVLAEARARAEALAEIDRAKTAFFSNVSHELRTPLTLLLGPTEDALRRPEGLPAEDVERWRLVHRNGLRLLKLVNTLLDFSRIEAGRMQASFEPTDLAPITRDLASAFESAVASAGLRLELAIESLDEPVFVDRDMWEKVVLNLLSNAFKFTFAGEIEVALHRSGDQAVLTVRDTGIGVPPEQLPLLFDRFHRVPDARSRTHEGTGIGLSLVQELVKLHGGTITATSTAGLGTTFRVALPLGTAHLPADRIAAPRSLGSTADGTAPYVTEALRWSVDSDSGAPPPPPSQAGRILLADDNADMRNYITRLLQDRWSVEAVADGATALERARETLPDLILSDIMMPGLDGYQLLQILQADPATRGIPVIFLSARAGEEARVEGLTAGADDYLVKPFSARELIARVGTRLETVRARREIEAARKLLEAVVNQIPAGVIVAEAPSGRTLLANERVRTILGYPPLPTRSIGDFAAYTAVHPDGRPYAAQDYALTRALAGEVIQEQEILLIHADGSRRTLSASATPVYDADGTIIAAVNAFSDVSDRKREEEQRQELLLREREARAEAEVANRSKDEFLAMLGHELRNPLAPIVTALHLMHLRGDETLQRERTIIERQVNHLVRLVDDLLDISRVTRGKVDLKRERIEVSEVVAKAIEMASPLIEQRQHQLVIDIPKGLVLEADAVRMAQVVANLLNNAAKYTEVHGTITVTAGNEDGEIVLRVRDTGIGLSAEMLPRVFDLFVQESQALDRAQGGLGLGLAIVRSLVELHGGTVEARSEGHGHGTELIVRLPAASPAPEPAASGEPLQEHTVATRPDALRVLVVDDNVDTAELLAEGVRMMGHVAQVAHDGLAALRIAAQLHPDVALLDIGLPVMDGYELARHLRGLPGLAALRLVAVTGYDQEADRRHTAAAGFERHLVKPIHLEQLDGILSPLGQAPAA